MLIAASFWIVLTYVSVTATSMGVSESFSFYLVSIANASGGVGRIGSGFLADKFGKSFKTSLCSNTDPPQVQ